MNFLAHLLICDPTPAARLGSVLPDLMRVRPGDSLPEDVRRAVDQHRRVDRATDGHWAFIACRESLGGELGRYSGVCLDVFFDYALSVRWERHCREERGVFIASVYRDIMGLGGQAPEAVRDALARMVEEDWLGAYATHEGIGRVFARMSVRLSARFGRAVELEPFAGVLERRFEEVDRAFDVVFRDVRGQEMRLGRG